MTALKCHFEDCLADQKARDWIKTIKQRHCPVAKYTEEFRDLACRLNWPEDILISCFQDGLNNDLYACVAQGVPAHLYEWCVLV